MPDEIDEIDEIEKRIFSTFGEVASSIGYSPLHGQIIAALLVKGKAIPLQELARETGYSSSMISLSLDLLEIVGVIRKSKKSNDRQLYIELSGDLLESLKKAIIMKMEKSVTNSLKEFEESKKKLQKIKDPEKERLLKTIEILEKQVRRLENYINFLSRMKLP